MVNIKKVLYQNIKDDILFTLNCHFLKIKKKNPLCRFILKRTEKLLKTAFSDNALYLFQDRLFANFLLWRCPHSNYEQELHPIKPKL
jgi:hypothetical protein